MVALTTDDFISSVHVFGRDGAGTWSDQGLLDAGTDLHFEIGLDLEGDGALVTGGSGTFYTFIRSGDTMDSRAPLWRSVDYFC